jgi:hypothetical protein
MEDLFYLIVVALTVVGEYWLFRIAERYRIWILCCLFALAWPVMVWFGVVIAWLGIACGVGGACLA